jgi:hypothetical protein
MFETYSMACEHRNLSEVITKVFQTFHFRILSYEAMTCKLLPRSMISSQRDDFGRTLYKSHGCLLLENRVFLLALLAMGFRSAEWLSGKGVANDEQID